MFKFFVTRRYQFCLLLTFTSAKKKHDSHLRSQVQNFFVFSFKCVADFLGERCAMTFVKHWCFRLLIKWVIVSLFNVKAVQVNGTRKAFDWTSNGYVRYDAESVVQCLDSLSEQDGDQLPHRHFVFMGDSRIRHLFYSFTQVYQ